MKSFFLSTSLLVLSAVLPGQVQAYDYTFTLSSKEAQYIFEVLRNTPLRHADVDEVVKKFLAQVDAQDKKVKEETQKAADEVEKQKMLEVIDRVLHPEKFEKKAN